MVLYLIYRQPKPAVKELECKDPELGVVRNSTTEVHPIDSKSPSSSDEEASEEEERANKGNENIQV
jgi:hypothetical protein